MFVLHCEKWNDNHNFKPWNSILDLSPHNKTPSTPSYLYLFVKPPSPNSFSFWNEQPYTWDLNSVFFFPCRPQLTEWIYTGPPSRVTTDEPPSFSAKVRRSLMSSKPLTCHSCLIPTIEQSGQMWRKNIDKWIKYPRHTHTAVGQHYDSFNLKT